MSRSLAKKFRKFGVTDEAFSSLVIEAPKSTSYLARLVAACPLEGTLSEHVTQRDSKRMGRDDDPAETFA